MPRRPAISKSAFIRGRQCLKSLYLSKRHPELQDPVPEALQATFDRGHSVGELAQQLFPGGVLAAYDLPEGFIRSMYRTKNLIEQGHHVIYEAGFMVNGTHCFVDILVKDGEKWKLFEVKSSTKVSEVYLFDAAFQHFVVTAAGLHVSEVCIIHINNRYVRQGDLDIRSLFTVQAVTDEAGALQGEVRMLLESEWAALQGRSVPDIPIGMQCFDPYACDFMGHCWQGVPGYSVFDITRLGLEKKFELFRRGIVSTADIPDEYPLSEAQRLQVQADRTDKAIVDRQAISGFLSTLSHPLYFLDFETFAPAIPRHDRSRPYQQLVFQYSLHILESPGGPVQHREFLASPGSDPRLQVLDQLVADLGTTGSIVVYNQGFEAGRLQEMAEDFPRYVPAIGQVLERLADLMVPFRKKWLYTPAMKGSYSIKQVLPALLPSFRYDRLAIADGESASLAFERLLGEGDPAVIEETRRNLLAYCRMDTLAMVALLEVLEEVVLSD